MDTANKIVGGIAAVVMLGLIASNAKNLAALMNALGTAFGTAAVASVGGTNYPRAVA